MSDPRFTTDVSDVDELLRIVDIDSLEDVETLLMFLFARPVRVSEGRYDDDGYSALEVVLRGDDATIGSLLDFPLNVSQLVRWCADIVDDLGPYGADDSRAVDAFNVIALDEDRRAAALEEALGMVRLFNMTERLRSE